MTKKNGTKRSLLMSAVALVLCFSMLVGSTFAWFTDSVTSSNNIIASGKLDVEMMWADGTKAVPADGSADWKNAASGAIFNNDKWEPGYVEAKHVKISNVGTLAFKYKLNIVPTGTVSELANVIDVYFVDGAQAVTRDMIAAATPVGTLAQMIADPDGAAYGTLEATGTTEKIVTIALKMQESAGNEYMEKSIGSSFAVKLLAAQLEAEIDSFDNTYDKFADYDGEISNVTTLAAALAKGGTYKVVSDIDVSESMTVPADVTVNLDLNGKTITGTVGRDADNNRIHTLVNNGTLNLVGGTVKSAGNDGGSAILNNAGATLTIEDVTVYGAPLSNPVYPVPAYPSYGINNYGTMTVNGAIIKTYHGAIATGENGVTVINDAEIDVGQGTSTGVTSYVIYSFDNAQVTVNDGTFAFTKQEVYVNGGNTFCELGTNPIIVNGGNYIGTSFSTGAGREYVIKGGTFDADPSAYVATGYTAVENNGLYYVVSGNVNKVITTAADLQALSATAFTDNNGTAESYTIELLGDIDMGGADFSAMIAQRGDTLTINGNGHKISNVNVVSGANDNTTGQASMFYAYPNSTLNVSDLTLENITVTSEANGTGYAAAVVGFCEGATVLDNVDVVNATVTGVKSSGMLAGHVGNGGTLTATNCDVSGTVTLTDYEAGGHYAGKYIGTLAGPATLTDCTANVTVSGNLNAANIGDVYGRKTVDGSLTIDGTVQKEASSQDGFNNAIASDNTVNVTLAAGNYVMPDGLSNGAATNLQGKDLTIKGTKDTVIDATAISVNDQFVTGADLVFDGVTLKFNGDDPSKLYMGFANTANLTYRNCHITGLQILNGQNVTFENCVIDSSANTMGQPHSVWTYGAKNVSFTNCEFIYGHRAVNCYKDQDIDGGKQVVNFKNCTFTTTDVNSEGGVEINSSAFSIGIEVNLDGCTAPAYGPMAYVSPWDGTNGAKTTINIQ